MSSSISHGAMIQTGASIVFDENPAIATNTWENTVDDQVPLSSLQAVSTSDTTVTLAAAASDGGSGVAGLDVYLAIDGGAYTRIATIAADSQFVYRAVEPGLHLFYSRAFDYVGLREDTPGAPDVTVTFSEIVSVLITSISVQEMNGNVVVAWQASSEANVSSFELQRAGEDGIFTELPSTEIQCELGSTCAFVDTTTEPGQVYYYRLAYTEDRSWTSEVYRVSVAPVRFSFIAMSPNPARAVARLDFLAPSNERVRMEVYDVSGRRVRKVDMPQTRRGHGAYKWDLRNDRGTRVASGMYFVRLSGAKKSAIRKILVVR